jgi:hypothetical protein
MVPVLNWRSWRYIVVKGPAFDGLIARMRHRAFHAKGAARAALIDSVRSMHVLTLYVFNKWIKPGAKVQSDR